MKRTLNADHLIRYYSQRTERRRGNNCSKDNDNNSRCIEVTNPLTTRLQQTQIMKSLIKIMTIMMERVMMLRQDTKITLERLLSEPTSHPLAHSTPSRPPPRHHVNYAPRPLHAPAPIPCPRAHSMPPHPLPIPHPHTPTTYQPAHSPPLYLIPAPALTSRPLHPPHRPPPHHMPSPLDSPLCSGESRSRDVIIRDLRSVDIN